jgi:NADPH:quinone reductase-like Zn-dependent oxidoreductase
LKNPEDIVWDDTESMKTNKGRKMVTKDTMKAIIYEKYGPPDVLHIGEAEIPIPKDNEVLVKVSAAAINFGNLVLVAGKPFPTRVESGWFRPKKILNPGSDVSGRVEAVGKNVSKFKPGDEIFADNLPGGYGTYAEYVCVPEKEMALKPNNCSFIESAAVPQAALVALQGLRDVGQIQAGQKVLITGASGGNGTYAVQIAKAFGTDVTGVCSTRNLELVKSLGADQVIDYTREDFVESGETYDLILAMGGYRPLEDYEKVLLPGGIFVWAGGDLKGLFETMRKGRGLGRKTNKILSNLSHHSSQDDLKFMAQLMEDDKVRSVIDKVFPLDETAAAFRHYQGGHMQGKVVIQVCKEDQS